MFQDDNLVPTSPAVNHIDNFADNEPNENLELFENGSTNGEDTIFQITNPTETIIPEEKRNLRRSRIQEVIFFFLILINIIFQKEEEESADDEEIFTRRTKTILNSIAQKLRTNDQVYFCFVYLIKYYILDFFS